MFSFELTESESLENYDISIFSYGKGVLKDLEEYFGIFVFIWSL